MFSSLLNLMLRFFAIKGYRLYHMVQVIDDNPQQKHYSMNME